MAATVPGSSTLGITEEQKRGFKKVLGLRPERNDEELYALFRADSLNRFYVPAVMMDVSERRQPSLSRTVHVLGHDVRAKFMSHSLQGVYDEVKPVHPWRNDSYQNVSFSKSRKSTGGHVEANAAEVRKRKKPVKEEMDDGHISDLVVSGSASEAIPLLESVKHRVDQHTAVCFMQEGLGVAEAANNEVFTDAEARPSMILGHTTQSFARDRRQNAIRSMKPNYETYVTGVRPYYPQKPAHESVTLEPTSESWLRTQGMLSKIAVSQRLRATGIPLDRWLEVKIPSLMFSSVVEPICVMLDYRYRELVYNPTANRLVDQLLDEIAEVVAHLPEMRNTSEHLVQMLRGRNMRKSIVMQLLGKKDAPSRMLQQIQKGELTDIDYLNGYFLERGAKMGIRMPANEMIIGLVKAKHKAEVTKLQSWVPLEVTSRRDL